MSTRRCQCGPHPHPHPHPGACGRACPGRVLRPGAWMAGVLVLVYGLLSCAEDWSRAAGQEDLALHRPACASSTEDAEHGAAQANDGDDGTSWCADDEPEDGPEWWQVDLGRASDLSGCQIRWPFAGRRYRYRVEGSGDSAEWTLLSDQTASTTTAQVHDLPFRDARAVRYLRVTVTGFDDGCWASISEVKVFGSARTKGEPR